MKGMSLRWKLLVALAALSVVPLVVAMIFVSGLTERLIRRDLLQMAEKTGNFVERSTMASRQEIANYISLLSSGADMVNAVFYASLTGETEQLEEPVRTAREKYQFDLLEVLDPQGKIVVSSSREDLSGTPVPTEENPVIRRSLAGEAASAITSRHGRLAVTVATPVQLQGQTAGHLVGTVFLDDTFAERIRDLSGAQVAFFDAGKMVAGSHPRLKSLELSEAPTDGSGETILDDTPYRLFRRGLEGETRGIVLALDRSEEIASRRSVRLLLGAILLAAIALALGVGFAFSRRMVRPLSEVVGSLRDIADGEGDLTRTLEVTAGDEVGELADNFNRFVHRLREMVGRIGTVSGDVLVATEKIRLSSQEVNLGANRQSYALQESFEAIKGIEESISGIAASTGTLLEGVESSSSATLELGAATSEIAHHMEHLFTLIDQVSSSIVQMSSTGQQVAQNVEALSLTTETSASSLTQLDSSIQQIEENAQETKRLAEAAVRDAEQGRETVEATIQGIGVIHQMVGNATTLIQDLGKRSQEIGGILTVIDEVADQTNLLALNAAIIAAQAGSHGRGFAVVAEEIRELAERTATSTREIAAIINRLQSGVGEAVKTMTTGNEQVRREVERSQAASEALEKIRTSTEKSTEQVRRIVQATQEQARGSQHITQSINHVASTLAQISSATREQSAGTEELAQASETMRDIASQVKQSTGEQARGSQQIVSTMEEIRRMVERINTATLEQSTRSRQAVQAVSEVRTVAGAYSSRAVELDTVVEVLSEQAAALQKEVGAFRS